MLKETPLPQIPSLEGIADPALKRVLQAFKDILETREAVRPRADPLDSTLTVRKAWQLGFVAVQDPATGRAVSAPAPGLPGLIPTAGGTTTIVQSGGGGGAGASGPDLTPPPTPTGLAAANGVLRVFLEWDAVPANNHAYTEVWRAIGENNRSVALLHDRALGEFYVDDRVSVGTAYYYWLRFVSAADVAGAYNAGVASGVAGSPAAVGTTELLEGGVTNTILDRVTANKVQIEDADILRAGVNRLKVVNADISGALQSDNYAPGNAGWMITKNGSVEFNTGAFRDALIAGTMAVSSTGNIRGGQSNYMAGGGFWMGNHAGAYKWSVGDGANYYMAWDGVRPLIQSQNFAIDAAGNVRLGAAGGARVQWDQAAGNLSIYNAANHLLLTSGTSLGRMFGNLLDSSRWQHGTHGGQPGFNQNGGFYEQYITFADGPDGTRVPVWQCYPGLYYNNAYTWDGGPHPGSQPAGDADGGWHTDVFPVDRSKPYRFSVFVMRSGGTSGTTYLGVQPNTVADLDGGAPNENPYFWNGNLPVYGRWYLIAGYVWPEGTPWGQTSKGGVWDCFTGKKVADGYDFRWAAGITGTYHRAYLYYSAPGCFQHFFDPRVEMITGAEPSIHQLLAGGAVSGRNPITAGNIGTYMASAAIGSAQIAIAAIGEAHIGDANVSTLKIKGNAVTLPTWTMDWATREFWGDSGWYWGLGITSSGGAILVDVGAGIRHQPNGTIYSGTIRLMILRDSATVIYDYTASSTGQAIFAHMIDTPGAGYHTYHLRFLTSWSGFLEGSGPTAGTHFHATYATIRLVETKR